jgi:hypothetical protein
MASQTVRFEYDAARNILFVEDDYEIATESDVDAFLSLYDSELRRIGRKVWIVTSIDGLRVGAKVYDRYGQSLKALAERWYLGLARWGTDPISRMTVRSSSLLAKYEVNIHDTKEQAVAAIEQAQQRAQGQAVTGS